MPRAGNDGTINKLQEENAKIRQELDAEMSASDTLRHHSNAILTQLHSTMAAFQNQANITGDAQAKLNAASACIAELRMQCQQLMTDRDKWVQSHRNQVEICVNIQTQYDAMAYAYHVISRTSAMIETECVGVKAKNEELKLRISELESGQHREYEKLKKMYDDGLQRENDLSKQVDNLKLQAKELGDVRAENLRLQNDLIQAK